MKGGEIAMITKEELLHPQYRYLSSTYLIHDVDEILSNYAREANNLYNIGMYIMRQNFIKHKKFLSYFQLCYAIDNKVKARENLVYRKLPYAQSSQQTLKEVQSTFDSWIKALKSYKVNPNKFTGRPRMPKYLSKGQQHLFYISGQNVRIRNGYLIIPRLSQFNIKLNPYLQNIKIKRVLFKPMSKGYFKVIVQYQLNYKITYLPDNGKYIGIDPGLDNVFTLVDSTCNHRPLIINGKPVKSMNQYYNKNRAKLYSLLAKYHQNEMIVNTKQGKKSIYFESNRLIKLTLKRNQKLFDFIHKATKSIVDYTLNCGANTIIIGKNKNMKRSMNLGKRINQNFIGIPHNRIIEILKYKANLKGITVIITDESYTSQTSFLDSEKPCKENGNYIRKTKHLIPCNRRLHRGLFQSNSGTLINADVNGAYQIIRKVFSNVKFIQFNQEIRGLVLSPSKLTIKC